MNSQPSLQQGMLCPVCRVPLSMSERHGVEIDFCPQCRGVWLDRGELDKIIARSEWITAPRTGPAVWPQPDTSEHESRAHDRSGHRGHRRRRGFLSDLFD